MKLFMVLLYLKEARVLNLLIDFMKFICVLNVVRIETNLGVLGMWVAKYIRLATNLGVDIIS